MTKLICAALMLVGIATSCKKPTTENQPTPTAAYSRTLTFPNQGNLVKAQAYASADRLEPSASISENKLSLLFTAPPKTDGSKGEAILIELDAATASSALVREYNLTNTSGKINNVRFTYQERNNSGNIWGSITEKAIGVAFTGNLHITQYDPRFRTISGTYLIEARGLINDPTINNVASPINPLNQCDLKLTGNFQNIRVQ